MSREEMANDYFLEKHKKNMKKLKKDLPNMISDYIDFCTTYTNTYSNYSNELKTEDDMYYAVMDGFVRKYLTYMLEDIVKEIYKKRERDIL